MPISGLVITLSEQADLARSAVQQIRGNAQVRLGDREGRRIPLVLDTPDPSTDKRTWNWLNELPGVTWVDVVFIHFDAAEHPGRPDPRSDCTSVEI